MKTTTINHHGATYEVINEQPAATPEMLAEADRLMADRRRMLQRREESFQRCDTDGFLSQWADGINANLDEAKAELLRAGGAAPMLVLIDEKAGRKVDAKRISVQSYGRPWEKEMVWRLSDAEERRLGRRFIPVTYADRLKKSRVQKQLGLREVYEWRPAKAIIGGGGRGLSGCASARVIIVPLDHEEEE